MWLWQASRKAERGRHVVRVSDHNEGIADLTDPRTVLPVSPSRTPATVVRRCADVLCDGTGRVGVLSYLVPDGLTVRLGDAVRVPFGTREVHGVVVGPGNASRATRPILEVFGKRTEAADITLARSLARYHFADVTSVFPRLAPRSGRGADPVEDRVITLRDDLPGPWPVPGSTDRRTLVRAPLVDPAALAAREAARLAAAGEDTQVLVLCPTVELVADVLACFTSGAQRLDAKAPRGAWKGFCEGTVRVGVGTRAAALYSAAHLGGVIVVEEDHPGHVEAVQPHTHARDVASARTRNLGLPLVLTSATPTPSALAAGAEVLAVGSSTDWPRMRLVDRSDLDPRQRLLPTALTTALRAAERAGHSPVVLAGRRKAVRRCVRCREPRPCAECTSSLCRHPEPTPCPRCDATDVRVAGWDAERLGDLLGQRAQVVDLPTLAETKNAGLVVLFDIDAALASPELVPDTLASHVVMSAARAAGPGGTLLALTGDAAAPLLADYFIRRDQLAVARRAVTAARDAGLPPFGRLVTVRSGQARAPRTDGWPGTVWGPRRSGEEWEVLVGLTNQALESFRPHVVKLRRGGKVRITVS